MGLIERIIVGAILGTTGGVAISTFIAEQVTTLTAALATAGLGG